MKRFVIISLSLMAVLLSFSCATNIDAEYSDSSSWVFPVSDVESIDINVSTAAVDVKLWGNPEICVVVENSSSGRALCYIKDETLLVKLDRSDEGFSCKVKVFCPESFFAEEWKISTKSGSVTASQLWCDSCEIDAVSGSIMLDKCEVQGLELTAVSGSIKAEYLICSGMGDFTTTSGSVKISGILDKTDISTASGSVQLDLLAPFVSNSCISTLSGSIKLAMPENDGFELEYDTLSGSVKNDFTAHKGSGSGTDTYKQGGVKIETETLSGSVYIEKR